MMRMTSDPEHLLAYMTPFFNTWLDLLLVNAPYFDPEKLLVQHPLEAETPERVKHLQLPFSIVLEAASPNFQKDPALAALRDAYPPSSSRSFMFLEEVWDWAQEASTYPSSELPSKVTTVLTAHQRVTRDLQEHISMMMMIPSRAEAMAKIKPEDLERIRRQLDLPRRQRLASAWLNTLQAYRGSMEPEKLRRRYQIPRGQYLIAAFLDDAQERPPADAPSAGPKTMAQLTADAERDTNRLIQLGMLVATTEPSQMSRNWEKHLVDAIVKVAEDQKLAWFIMMLRRAKDLLLQFAPATPPSLAASAADEEFVQVISAFFVFDGQATARPK